jgi:hypothetical protein
MFCDGVDVILYTDGINSLVKNYLYGKYVRNIIHQYRNRSRIKK